MFSGHEIDNQDNNSEADVTAWIESVFTPDVIQSMPQPLPPNNLYTNQLQLSQETPVAVVNTANPNNKKRKALNLPGDPDEEDLMENIKSLKSEVGKLRANLEEEKEARIQLENNLSQTKDTVNLLLKTLHTKQQDINTLERKINEIVIYFNALAREVQVLDLCTPKIFAPTMPHPSTLSQPGRQPSENQSLKRQQEPVKNLSPSPRVLHVADKQPTQETQNPSALQFFPVQQAATSKPPTRREISHSPPQSSVPTQGIQYFQFPVSNLRREDPAPQHVPAQVYNSFKS